MSARSSVQTAAVGLFSLEGKVAVVTGGGRGLGRHLALGLAAQGARLAVLGRTPSTVKSAAAEITAGGGSAIAVPADLAQPGDIERAIERVVASYGCIDVLVNNAAAATPLKPAEEITPEEWDAVMDVNLRGTFFLTTGVARLMKESGGGSVVNISSIMQEVGGPRASVYCASKGALGQLTRTLAVEWARYGIRVNAVAPGYVRTDMTDGLQGNAKLDEYVTSRTPMHRWGTPRELVGAVIYLASDASSFQTGQTILVDGGFTAW